ncbi:helix-turn-helix domain-containing protein [Ruegeria marisflavi]|uniref:helix-turn-helix domain-containing protein n=1 Tax=Ruegeria marisflavi TaxID=2984152 RepID=UPI0037CB8AE1
MKSGAELNAKRTEAGFSQREVARRAGLSHKAVQHWESKQRLDAAAYGLMTIFRALGSEAEFFWQSKTTRLANVLLGSTSSRARRAGSRWPSRHSKRLERHIRAILTLTFRRNCLQLILVDASQVVPIKGGNTD